MLTAALYAVRMERIMQKDLNAINDLVYWIGYGIFGLIGAAFVITCIYWVVAHWQASAVGALTLAALVLASQWEEG